MTRAAKLLKYCATHGHWSVFEMGNMVVEITTTRDISRQLLRHRSFSFQEFSQRYSEVSNYTVQREARTQDLKNRQNSNEVDDPALQQAFSEMQAMTLATATLNYESALTMGIAKEQARSLLPEGLTETKMYMNGTIRSWIHYLKLRCGNGTQKEHKEIADMIKVILLEQLPVLKEVLEDV
ncbi:thymidylate synthase [Pseudoalteromonas phage vB_PtuP_Slicky01]|nr:thymidylate synthase [Pseudoalteromonas phage vB_PtuP_Slicky01]